MKNVSEISNSVNQLTKDKEIQGKVVQTINNVDKSMCILTELLEKVDNMSPEDKAKITSIMSDTAETSKNLKKFSEKLNKRFLLFRLMF